MPESIGTTEQAIREAQALIDQILTVLQQHGVKNPTLSSDQRRLVEIQASIKSGSVTSEQIQVLREISAALAAIAADVHSAGRRAQAAEKRPAAPVVRLPVRMPEQAVAGAVSDLLAVEVRDKFAALDGHFRDVLKVRRIGSVAGTL